MHHQITIITVNLYRPSPKCRVGSPPHRQPFTQTGRKSVTQTLGDTGSMKSLKDTKSLFSWQSFPLFPTIVQASQVYPMFYIHHKFRMTDNLRAILRLFGRINRSSRYLGKAENYQYQVKESMKILVVIQLTYSHR